MDDILVNGVAKEGLGSERGVNGAVCKDGADVAIK
jgi:hypothetical protein